MILVTDIFVLPCISFRKFWVGCISGVVINPSFAPSKCVLVDQSPRGTSLIVPMSLWRRWHRSQNPVTTGTAIRHRSAYGCFCVSFLLRLKMQWEPRSWIWHRRFISSSWLLLRFSWQPWPFGSQTLRVCSSGIEAGCCSVVPKLAELLVWESRLLLRLAVPWLAAPKSTWANVLVGHSARTAVRSVSASLEPTHKTVWCGP